MEKIIYTLVLILAPGFFMSVFSQRLVFKYDEAGNQISRQWVCANCLTEEEQAAADSAAAAMQSAGLFASASEDLSSDTISFEDVFQPTHVVSVYPNPVSQTLQVRWESNLKVPVKEIYLNSMTGTLLLRQAVSQGQHELAINFSSYPPGSYTLLAFFADGRRESIIVIKVD